MLHFHLLEIGNWVESDQSTGRLIRIPNAKILTDPIANYTSEFPFLWHEIPVVITFESDWQRAKTLLLEMVTQASAETSRRAAECLQNRPSQMLISYGTVTATVYTSVLDHGICLSMRFLTDPRRRRQFDQTLWGGYARPGVQGARRPVGLPDPAPRRPRGGGAGFRRRPDPSLPGVGGGISLALRASRRVSATYPVVRFAPSR